MHPHIAAELARLQPRWPLLSFDEALQCWTISEWNLSSGWSLAQTPIWIPCPGAYPQTPPDNFYTAAALKLGNGGEPGNSSSANLAGAAVRCFSFHVETSEWSPERGDSIETFLFGVARRLEELS
jgi:hypothetical protein